MSSPVAVADSDVNGAIVKVPIRARIVHVPDSRPYEQDGWEYKVTVFFEDATVLYKDGSSVGLPASTKEKSFQVFDQGDFYKQNQDFKNHYGPSEIQPAPDHSFTTVFSVDNKFRDADFTMEDFHLDRDNGETAQREWFFDNEVLVNLYDDQERGLHGAYYFALL